MNIRSGLFGAWLCFLIAWIAYCAWNSDIACLLERIGVHTSPGAWCKVQNAHYYGNFVLKMVGDCCPNACSIDGSRLDVAGFPLGRSPAREIRIDFSRSLKFRVLRLQPGPSPATHVARADALRDDAFEVHPARMTEDRRAVAGQRFTQWDAIVQRLVTTTKSSFARGFLRSPRGSGRTSWPSASMMS